MNQPRAFLTIAKGNELGRQYVLRPGQKFSIGRSFDNAISLADHSISRRHAIIEFSNLGLKVKDLGSSNGTILDGRRLSSESVQHYSPHGVLILGSHALKIEIKGLDLSSFEETSRIKREVIPSSEFDILGEIGRGATGIVYGAFQKVLKRNVAVKVPRTDVEDYEDSLRRFFQEGQLCSQVLSPYVVTVFDMRKTGDRPYIVMELVNGGSAKDRLSNSVIPIDEVAKIGEDIALALHAIHRLNIVHRDLKPSNILLSPEGIAKLADFGIAKKTGDVSGSGEGTSMTGSDEALGTLGYVSPEAASCSPIGSYTDIYSLGATLYHLITGKVPFVTPGISVADILNKVLWDDPIAPLLLREDCPPELSDLIMRMMSKEPANRPCDAITIALRFQKIKENYHGVPCGSLQSTDIYQSGTDMF